MKICEEFIKSNDLVSLFEWLDESELNCDKLWELLSQNYYSKFLCENVYFLYFGRLKRSLTVFQDADLNEVATTLGSMSIYSDGISSGIEDEYLQVEGYKRPENFIEIYREACESVDEDLAFGSIMQILSHTGQDFYNLLSILSGVIKRTEKGTSSLITSSLVSILSYIKPRKGIRLGPMVEFLESVWDTKDEQDKHGVASSSLISFSTNIISQLYTSNLLQLDGNSGPLCLANLVCKYNNNIYQWVCSISTMQSEPVSGPLDTVPFNEAICIFVLLSDKRSNVPRVYSLKTMALMGLKISNVFLVNQHKLTIDSANLGLNYLEKEFRCSDSEPISDFNTFPWHPIGYLAELLDSENDEWDEKESTKILKRSLSLCSQSVKLHILKGVVKLLKSEDGITITLMECKNTASIINKNDESEESPNRNVDSPIRSVETPNRNVESYVNGDRKIFELEEYFNFVKSVLDSYFSTDLVKNFGDSTLDSLSIVLNWIKFLLLTKRSRYFKKNIKNCFSLKLNELCDKLDEGFESRTESSHNLHISLVPINKLNLIKMLFTDVLDLLK
ncbi:hypothetical protein TpMuguga_03g02480 [Theileria parva strain Muguga]|uniref:uncharacterized protein n=1 Tax=Theileria parva strain Muguga TaxID=333668 RepID=UPI001C623745|nr:uncharacterized protein TpMuguga_03g02480 [Theileria parva strain Muguga]KAF5153148.1 hypothetical protein TpMuguga_03g02480 [Theileria parva strain Muguga]